MALSGGGGSGAGFGFVGATFGQTDLVSPYLQMQEQAEQAPPKFKPDPITLNAISAIDNDVLGTLVERHSENELFRSPQYMSAKTDGINYANQQEAEFFQNLIKEEKAQRDAMLNLKEISDLSYNTVTSKSSEILSTDSPLNNSHNQRKLNRYKQANAIKNIGVSRAGDGVDFIPKGNNVYMFIDKDFIKDGDDEDALDVKDFLAEYKDDLRIEEDKDGNLFVNMLSSAFHLNDGDFVEITNLQQLGRSLDVPILSKGEELESPDGLYYENEFGQRIALGQLRFNAAQDILANPSQFVRKGEGYDLVGDKVELSHIAAEAARKRGYGVDNENTLSNEDARELIETTVNIAASTQSFRESYKKRSIPDGSGSGARAKLNPNSIITTSEDGKEIPIRNLSDVAGVAEKTTDGYKDVADVQPTGAVSIDMTSKPFDVMQDGVKVYLTDLSKDKDGNVYYRVMVNPDEFNLLDAKKQELWRTKMFKKGLLGQKESNKSKWIKAKKEEMSNISSIMGLKEDYQNITNPAERVRTFIRDTDGMRSGVMQQGIGGFYDESDSQEEAQDDFSSLYE